MNTMVRYFFTVQPMHSIEEDKAYITNVVTGFFNPNNSKYTVYTWKNDDLVLADTWKKTKWFTELKKSVKRAWHDIVRHFKDVARTSIYTCYHALQIPIHQQCDLAHEWKPIINNLLKDWKYMDLVAHVGVPLCSVIQSNKWISKMTRTRSSFHFITWHLLQLCTK